MRVFSFSALVLTLGLMLAMPAQAADQPQHKLKFASQSVGSTGYNRNIAMANVMNQHLPEGWIIEVAPISTGGVAGTLLVESGNAELGEGINVPNHMLAKGEYSLKGKKLPVPQKAMSFLGGTDYAYYMIMFSEDFHKKAGVDTLEEVIAKKIPFNLVTKAPGSSGELGANVLLSALGVTYDDIKKLGGNVYQVAPPQMADLLRDGKADISIDVVGLGQPSMQELTMTKEMFFPQMAESTLQALEKEGYAPKVMPANSWKGQNKDVNTMVNASAYVVAKDIPEDVVYAMTKAIVENKPELVKQVPAMEQYVPEDSALPSINGLPFHPGAVKYYKEAGLMK